MTFENEKKIQNHLEDIICNYGHIKKQNQAQMIKMGKYAAFENMLKNCSK